MSEFSKEEMCEMYDTPEFASELEMFKWLASTCGLSIEVSRVGDSEDVDLKIQEASSGNVRLCKMDLFAFLVTVIDKATAKLFFDDIKNDMVTH